MLTPREKFAKPPFPSFHQIHWYFGNVSCALRCSIALHYNGDRFPHSTLQRQCCVSLDEPLPIAEVKCGLFWRESCFGSYILNRAQMANSVNWLKQFAWCGHTWPSFPIARGIKLFHMHPTQQACDMHLEISRHDTSVKFPALCNSRR